MMTREALIFILMIVRMNYRSELQGGTIRENYVKSF